MNILHLDFETRSACEIKLGHTRYAMHDTTMDLCMAYAENDEDTKLAIPGVGNIRPASILTAYLHRGFYFCAHNAGFEKAICEHVLGVHIPIERWICTAAMSRHFGLPGSLDGAAAALKMEMRKHNSSDLKKLWKPKPANNWIANHGGSWWFEPPERFVIPDNLPPPHLRKFNQERDKEAALFEQMYAYCKQDVEVERELHRRLPPLPARERRLWVLDAKINKRGIPVDVELARKGDAQSVEYVAERVKGFSKLTNGEVEKPSQREKLLDWCNRNGADLPNLQKQTVLDALETDLPQNVLDALEVRAATSGNAQSKFAKFALQVGPDHRLRDSFIFYGSHTGRWTSEGVQTNNMMRPEVKKPEFFVENFLEARDVDAFAFSWSPEQSAKYEEWQEGRKKDGKPYDLDTFYRCVRGALVRSTVKAPEGKLLIAMDYSAIEARGAMWAAQDEETLEAFRRNEKLYERTAAAIFNMPEEQIGKDSFQRMMGKKIFLGGQYGIGADKFVVSCQRDGVKNVDDELAETIVKKYRDRYKKIPELWNEIDDGVREAFTTGETVTVAGRFLFKVRRIDGILFFIITLPSGRNLYYPQAQYKQELRKCKVYVDGKWTGEYEQRLKWSFSYLSREGRKHTWGGGLLENIVQAFCRDLLCTAMLEAEHIDGAGIIMHVYDEIVLEVDEDKAQKAFDELDAIMRAGAPWAEGMPIACEGWIGKRYRK